MLHIQKTIRNYKKSITDIDALNLDFCSYDLTLNHPTPSSKYWNNKDEYKLDEIETKIKKIKKCKRDDNYKDVCYVISNLYRARAVNHDWLTGFVLASNLFTGICGTNYCCEVQSLHIGGLPGHLLEGIHHFCNGSQFSQERKVIWEWKIISKIHNRGYKQPFDNDEHDLYLANKKNFIRGYLKDGNISDTTNLLYLNKKNTDNNDLIVQDIYPDDKKVLYAGVITALNLLTKRGLFMLRLPNVLYWDTKIINVLFLLSTVFEQSKLWIPEWGNLDIRKGIKRYYFIGHIKKKNTIKSIVKKLMSRIDEPHETPLFKRMIFSNKEDDSLPFDEYYDWLDKLSNIKSEIINECIIKEEDDKDYVEYWLSKYGKGLTKTNSTIFKPSHN